MEHCKTFHQTTSTENQRISLPPENVNPHTQKLHVAKISLVASSLGKYLTAVGKLFSYPDIALYTQQTTNHAVLYPQYAGGEHQFSTKHQFPIHSYDLCLLCIKILKLASNSCQPQRSYENWRGIIVGQKLVLFPYSIPFAHLVATIQQAPLMTTHLALKIDRSSHSFAKTPCGRRRRGESIFLISGTISKRRHSRRCCSLVLTQLKIECSSLRTSTFRENNKKKLSLLYQSNFPPSFRKISSILTAMVIGYFEKFNSNSENWI